MKTQEEDREGVEHQEGGIEEVEGEEEERCIQVPQVVQESDDEAEIQIEDIRINELHANPFPGAIDDNEENEDDEALAAPQQALPEELFELLPPKALGDEQYCINGRDFIPGPANPVTSIDRFYNYSRRKKAKAVQPVP